MLPPGYDKRDWIGISKTTPQMKGTWIQWAMEIA